GRAAARRRDASDHPSILRAAPAPPCCARPERGREAQPVAPPVRPRGGAMKPRRFDYVRPDTVAEALALLAQHGEDAKVIAGGQSLMAMLNLRLLEPALLIDIARLAELDFIKVVGDKVLGDKVEVGAAITQNRLKDWPEL